MAPAPRIVSSIADVDAALADAAGPGPDGGDQLTVEAIVGAAVPYWLADAVAAVRQAGHRMSVVLSPQEGLSADAAAGWEIGVLTTVLSLGVDEVHGADPVRLRRVQAVLGHLEQP